MSQSQGPYLPTVDNANSDWSNPDNVQASDGAYVDSNFGVFNQVTGQLAGRGFGFTVPSGSVILGVEAVVLISASVDPSTIDMSSGKSGFFALENHNTGILGSGTTIKYDSTTWTVSPISITLGGPADLWGWGGWSDSVVNDANFGFQMRAGRSVGSTAHALVDSVTIKVYYSDISQADLVFGASGALLGAGALTGSAALVFSASLSPGDIVASSAALAFTGSATITATGVLAGTAALIVGTSPSTLAGSGMLVGASDTIAFFGFASSDGISALFADEPLVFGTSAELTGAGALVGSSALAFSAAEHEDFVRGSVALTVGATGTLAFVGGLRGESPLFFSINAKARGAGALVGAALLATTATGTIKGAGALVGSTSLTTSGSATLTGRGALLGSSALLVSTTTTLSGSGHLKSKADIVAFGASALLGNGALAGAAQLSFSTTGRLEQPDDQLCFEIAVWRIAFDLVLTECDMTVPATLRIGDTLAFQAQNVSSELDGSARPDAQMTWTLLDKLTRAQIATGSMSLSSDGPSTFDGRVDRTLTQQFDRVARPTGLIPRRHYELRVASYVSAVQVQTTRVLDLVAIL